MSVRQILTFPDPRLREISQPVTTFKKELKSLVDDMIETMYSAHGIGLAAPQIGELVRVIVIDTRPKDEEGKRYKYDEMSELEKSVRQPLVLINPEIIKGEGKTTFDEGCLSVPGYYETVERFNYVEMKSYDLKGNEVVIKTDGLLAICIQHEMDHLEGKLFIDRISFIKGNKIKNQIKKHGYPPVKKKGKNQEEDQEQNDDDKCEM